MLLLDVGEMRNGAGDIKIHKQHAYLPLNVL